MDARGEQGNCVSQSKGAATERECLEFLKREGLLPLTRRAEEIARTILRHGEAIAIPVGGGQETLSALFLEYLDQFRFA